MARDAVLLASDRDYREGALTDAKVMLVDDEALTLEVITTFLEESGYSHFITTTDPTEAMALMVREQPDIVLLDLMMPKVSGFDILGWMKADAELRYTPVVVLTSATDAPTKLRALELGATDFLAKPVDASELQLRLRNTLAFRAYQQRLAHYDLVTGLPNRRLFMKYAEQVLRSAQRHRYQCALLQVNLNRFKQINETLGQAAGDALLRETARRLQIAVRESDPVARGEDDESADLSHIGGDEFTVLLDQVSQVEHVSAVARRVQSALGQPYRVEGRDVNLSSRIGIALYPDDAADSATLLQHAGAAANYAKDASAGSYQFFSRETNAKAYERFMLENQLRKAIERDELVLHYQPKVDVQSGAILGAEALVRWQHPDLGLLPPGRFIPLAEQTKLVGAIGAWALHAACVVSKRLALTGASAMRIAVNVASDQFRDGGLSASLEAAIANSGCDARQIVLEITEGTLMDNAERSVQTMRAIKQIGANFSIDDFGTGYSSLSYLKRFPLDELKIDRSFINDVASDASDVAIVKAIISLARNLGLDVVAEGVETEEQLAVLRQHGCSKYQGYLFSKPVPEQTFFALLQHKAPAAGGLARHAR